VRVAALLALAAAVAALATPAPAAPQSAPTFNGAVKRIPADVRERMVSWHRGCPVPIRRLRLLAFNHHGLDDEVHRGRLIVHKAEAYKVLNVMRILFRKGFRMKQIWLVDAYGASDRRSMRADNTSAFNCRYVAGTTRWSQHAYGKAIDINPVENPYVDGDYVSPRNGRPYADRSRRAPGMIHAGDKVVRAFASIGWGWGGYWSGAKDYQHFSATGG
jgi:poly-gamma-glutamate synthesis protein (capsule biosynthesis protein)